MRLNSPTSALTKPSTAYFVHRPTPRKTDTLTDRKAAFSIPPKTFVLRGV